MEKKQLNFSAPLMSARRYPSPLRPSGEDERMDSPPKNPNLSPLKSDLNLGEVVKPGSVPFIWEKIPGKAEDGNESQIKSPHEVPKTTNIPPSLPFPPGKKSAELNGFKALRKLSSEFVVPRPRIKLSGELNFPRPHKFSGELGNLGSNKFSGEFNTLHPCSKLSGEEVMASSGNFYSSNDIIWDSLKEGTERKESSESDDNNATFSDAMETFSQHEPFSFNCSVSGLSQLEHSEPKLPNNYPTDPKARDFMMNRFLPAAKAMTLEPSQYASRKQHGIVEQPEEVKALVPRAMTPPPNPNMCKIVLYTGQDIGPEESEDDEDSYDQRSTLSVNDKACGFFPWFCSKNSLRLLNPPPSLKDSSRTALSSASKLGKLVKSKSWQFSSKKMVKDPCNNPKQVRQVYKSCELQNLPTYTPRPLFYSGELQTRCDSPYRSSRRSNVSPFRSESPPPLYQKGVGLLEVLRRVGSLDENQSKVPQKSSKRFEESRRKTKVSSTRTPVEKTRYLDSVNITKVSHPVLNLPKTKRQVELSVEEAVRLEYGGRLEILKARGRSGPLFRGGLILSQPSRTSDKGNTNTCRDLVLVSSDDTSTMQSSLTLPLPKSPSESWLYRQLLSVSPRNSVSYSNMNSKFLIRKQSAPTSGAKWENIVKSSHLHQDDGYYTEELVTHVPQQTRIWM